MASFWQMLRHDPVYTPVVEAFKGVFALQGLRFRITGEDKVPSEGPAVMMINVIGSATIASSQMWDESDNCVRTLTKRGSTTPA